MENVSFRMWSFLSDEWIFTEIGMSLPVNCKLDTGTAVKESRRLLNCWLRLVLKRRGAQTQLFPHSFIVGFSCWW